MTAESAEREGDGRAGAIDGTLVTPRTAAKIHIGGVGGEGGIRTLEGY